MPPTSPATAERARQAADLAALAAGRAQVVVTGQQPGFLGGPLYTLHKIATAVALARQLTAAGRPTVPVFWCGDDDDDLREALAPVAWSPPDQLVRSEALEAARRGRGERSLVGRLPGGPGQASGLAWLAARGSAADDPHGPAALWSAAAGRGLVLGPAAAPGPAADVRRPGAAGGLGRRRPAAPGRGAVLPRAGRRPAGTRGARPPQGRGPGRRGLAGPARSAGRGAAPVHRRRRRPARPWRGTCRPTADPCGRACCCAARCRTGCWRPGRWWSARASSPTCAS